MRILSKPQSLGEPGDRIDDVELFCRDALRRGLAAHRATLDGPDREEAVEFLMLQLRELWERYDPELSSSFSKFAYPILPLRLVDWYRKKFGDDRYGERPKVISLDEFVADRRDIVDHSSSAEEEVLFRVAYAPGC